MADGGTPRPPSGFVGGLYRFVRQLATDPRARGVLAAPWRTAGYLLQAWSRSQRPDDHGEYYPVRVSAGLATQVLVDEVVISAMKDPALFPLDPDYAAAGADIRTAHDLFQQRGWLTQPASYHRIPSAPEWHVTHGRRSLDIRFEHVCFPSGFVPRLGEPGRDRWINYEPNHTVHAWMLRHQGKPRPWLVCLHGFGQGRPLTDLGSFRVRQLHRQGLNILIPVLPLHGPRAVSPVRGQGFMSIDLIDSLHGLTQASWDVRRAIRWLRQEHAANGVGVYGHSLGGYVASLVASLEEDLACVIAGIPAIDLPDLYRRHGPPHVLRRAERAGALGETASAVHRVVSPLALEPRLPVERRFIFAGLGDRMSTFGHAHRLWLHWDRPPLVAYPGGHVGFYFSGAVQEFVRQALESSGLSPSRALGASR